MLSISFANTIVKSAVSALKASRNNTEAMLIIYGNHGSYPVRMSDARCDGHIEHHNPIYGLSDWRTNILPSVGSIDSIEIATESDISVTFTDSMIRVDNNGEYSIITYDNDQQYQWYNNYGSLIDKALSIL